MVFWCDCLQVSDLVPSTTMGLISSRTETPPLLNAVPLSSSKHHVRSGSTRSRAKQPMPDPAELDRRFIKVLVSTINQLPLSKHLFTTLLSDRCCEGPFVFILIALHSLKHFVFCRLFPDSWHLQYYDSCHVFFTDIPW